MADDTVRLSINVEKEFYKKITRDPVLSGIRSAIVRQLLNQVVEAGEKIGPGIYGMILAGQFTIEPNVETKE